MKRWQFWVGVVISAFFLYLALSNLKLSDLWNAIRNAQYWWLIPGVFVYFLGVWVRAWRWHYLLRPLKKIPTSAMFPIVSIGYMGNNIYPARAGEVLRAVILKQRTDVPISSSLATILVERIYDGVVMLAFVFVNLGELSRLTHNAGLGGNLDIRTIAIGGSIVFFSALIVFLLCAMFPKQTEKILYFFGQWLPENLREKILSIAIKFLSGLEALRSPIEALMIFFTTVIIWLLETAKYWFVMHAFPFEVSFFALMLMNGVVNLATTLPSAPGYIGTFDTPGIAVLVAYGVSPEIAAAYTLVLHGALWFPITLLGFYFYLKQPLRWGRDIQKTQALGSGEV